MLMDNLYLTNYCETGGLPFRSITRLPEKKAYDMARMLSEKTTSRKNRYGDYFDTYYHKRLRTEEWLYDEFIKLGGKPETEHPIYFVLTENQSLNDYFGNGIVNRISLSSISSEHISFTPRDSMHLMDMGRYENTVWRIETLIKMFNESGMTISNFIDNITAKYERPGGYIEVQLWSDRYLQHLG
ncbi:MAG TPA: hypothetical protein VN131_07360 [Mobilitalea sp.]|nr:hypothetical protein [Mobilitalea sp.]